MGKKSIVTIILVILILVGGCAQKDFRLLKNYYPSATDSPREVDVSISFPKKLKNGAVKNVLSLRLEITNNSSKDVKIDPSKIYLLIGTKMHSVLPVESVTSMNNLANIEQMALEREILKSGEAIAGMLYFPKFVAEKIEKEESFNLNIDAGSGKKIILIFKK